MKRTILNVAVIVPSLAVAFWLGMRCGDAAKERIDDHHTIARLCPIMTSANEVLHAEESANSEMPFGRVRYQIGWDQYREHFLIDGQTIDELNAAVWRNDRVWANWSGSRRFRIERPAEPTVFFWNTAHTRVKRRFDANEYQSAPDERDSEIHYRIKWDAATDQFIFEGFEKPFNRYPFSLADNRVVNSVNSFNSPLDRISLPRRR